MKKLLLIPFIFFLLLSFVFVRNSADDVNTGAPPYQVAEDPPGFSLDQYSYLKDWKRPEEPAKVALQVGHWKSDEAPDEQKRLRGNTGASGGGKSEWEVNMEIANLTADLLKKQGINVEILPTTVPPDYWADVFVSIHADGNPDPNKSGYKAAAPRRDMTGNADKLLEFVESEYEKSTGLTYDPNVTRNMRGYYAFGWWRYDHAVHPMTTSLILETGFLTSPSDREIIVENPEVSAEGLASGILRYLDSESLI
jgi:hypothetical protein